MLSILKWLLVFLKEVDVVSLAGLEPGQGRRGTVTS